MKSVPPRDYKLAHLSINHALLQLHFNRDYSMTYFAFFAKDLNTARIN